MNVITFTAPTEAFVSTDSQRELSRIGVLCVASAPNSDAAYVHAAPTAYVRPDKKTYDGASGDLENRPPAVSLVDQLFLARLVQFSRARTRRAALHHGLGGLFNAIGWLQARDIELLRLARGRVHATASGDAKLALQEFAAHLHHEHYALRLLHEQLAATARAAGDRDPRWAGDRTEGTDEQLEPFLTRSQAV